MIPISEQLKKESIESLKESGSIIRDNLSLSAQAALIWMIGIDVGATLFILYLSLFSLFIKRSLYFWSPYNWLDIFNIGIHFSIIIFLLLELKHKTRDEFEQDTKQVRILIVFGVILGFMK